MTQESARRRAALAVATARAVSGAVLRVDATGGLAATDRPGGWYALADRSGLLATLAFMVAFIARQALSWRRSTGERRQQLKWLASGAAVAVCSAVLAAASGTATGLWALLGLAWFGFAALPLSIGVGILKYRLYEIDRIISRTLAFAPGSGRCSRACSWPSTWCCGTTRSPTSGPALPR